MAWVTNLRKPDPSKPDQAPSRWIHARHVDLLDDFLLKLHARELIKDGYIGLIVEEPPRHGKSELGTHYDSVYYLGAHPDDRIILASYAAEFASEWGGKVRETFRTWAPTLFGLNVSKTVHAADRWDIFGRKGGMYTAGAGGPITGRGANYLKADDLIKNYQEAQSETLRNNIWNWWISTFRTRLEPGGVILVIGTRWHEDDIIGRLLAAQGEGALGLNDPLYDPSADRFLRIRLPALAEGPDDIPADEVYVPDALGRSPGEALFPERYPVEKLRPYMANALNWAALYQQRPTTVEGMLFHRDWFEVVPNPSGRFRVVVRRWDMAATDPKKGDDPDWTVGVKYGLHTDGYYYVLDMVRVRESPGSVLKTMAATARSDGRSVRIRAEQEPGSAGKIVIYTLGRTVFSGYPFRGRRSTGNKILRAETAAGAAERGEIRVVRGPWNREFFHEVTRFPNAAHDDIVDSFAGAHEDLTKRSTTVKSW